jgi:hypothetical protein
MLTLASQLAAQAWASDQAHTVYFEPADDSAGPDHPRALLQHSAKKAIAYDQIPADATIRRLYESDDLTAFIAAVLAQAGAIPQRRPAGCTGDRDLRRRR